MAQDFEVTGWNQAGLPLLVTLSVAIHEPPQYGGDLLVSTSRNFGPVKADIWEEASSLLRSIALADASPKPYMHQESREEPQG